MIDWNWSIDGWIVTVGALCGIAAALLGNFLVLRRMSMLGDAISHAVLPGLAIAFLWSGSRSGWPMFVGAAVVGVLTALFTEWIRDSGKVDEGASMGVVFTSLFALGLLLIVQAADRVDLDPSCVLYGAIELTPLDRIAIGSWQIPQAAATLAVVAMLNAAFVTLFFKELKLAAFDPALGTTAGFNSRLLHYALMVLVAITAVASFEAVGNILVVAMLVVPPATAYLMTDRLWLMVLLSAVLAVIAAILGHLGALVIPQFFGLQSTTTAGMMAVAAGGVLAIAALFAPRYGLVTTFVRRSILSWGILADDAVALLYRRSERGLGPVRTALLADELLARRWPLVTALLWLRARGQVARNPAGYVLTPTGSTRARNLVRSHRLWEQYLVTEAGVGTDRIHAQAERLEHFTDAATREALNAATRSPQLDPHGSPIPPDATDSPSR